jgi:UMF1 family MFS transporter
MPGMSAASSPSAAGPDRFTAFAWILLDWAASAFSTVLITLIVAYVERIAFVDRPWGLAPGVVWSWTLAAAMLASAVAAPGFSAWADRRGRHQAALMASVVVGAAALLVLSAAQPSARMVIVAAVAVANVGFDMAAIFTGSLLARITTGRLADRLSAAGFAAGYAGGAVALLAATAIATGHDALGLTIAGGLRAAFAFTAAWWLCFSLPAAGARFETAGTGHAGHAPTAVGELAAFGRTLVESRHGDGRHLAAVLAGSTLILGAVQTAIAQFSSVAIEEFDLEPAALVRLVLLVQAVALPGALLVGWLAERLGRRTALAGCLAGWMAVLVLAWFVRTVPQLHALAVLLALVLGGVQSVIRATVADAAPAGRAGVSFGLLQVGSKLAGAAAGLLFGWLYLASGQSRAGLAALLLQLLAGWWFLRRMDGRKTRQESPSTSRIE